MYGHWDTMRLTKVCPVGSPVNSHTPMRKNTTRKEANEVARTILFRSKPLRRITMVYFTRVNALQRQKHTCATRSSPKRLERRATHSTKTVAPDWLVSFSPCRVRSRSVKGMARGWSNIAGRRSRKIATMDASADTAAKNAMPSRMVHGACNLFIEPPPATMPPFSPFSCTPERIYKRV